MATGGEILVDVLARENVAHVYTVPGESFISALDAMYQHPYVAPIVCRNEGGAAMMAEAEGKLRGRPGVALVTRGPGAANAFSGVFVAHQDATAMVLLVGLPPRAFHGLPAFQAIDIEAVFGSVAKWVVTVENASELSNVLSRAFGAAASDRPGPVVVGLPEDVLSEHEAAIPSYGKAEIAKRPLRNDDLRHIASALSKAERPLVVLGGSEWSEEAAQDLAAFAERFDLPVVTSFRRQDHFDNRHHCFAGHAGFAIDPMLLSGLKAADVVIAIGTRLGEVTTQGFQVLNGSIDGQTILHIAPDADDYHFALNVTHTLPATASLAVKQLAELEVQGGRASWSSWRRDLRAAYLASLNPQPTPGKVHLEEIVRQLSIALPDDAILCNGAGNYAAFLHRYFEYKQWGTELAPVSGSMGYGLPAAVAAKLNFPNRIVIAFAGDGCIQMTGQELATAVQYGLPIVIVVANNGAFGTIRMHQERKYPGRVIGTTLVNPNFAAWAESFGAVGIRVETSEEVPQAFERAFCAQGPCLIELIIDADAISVRETITSIRASAPKQDEA